MQGLKTSVRNIESGKIRMSNLYADLISDDQSKNCVATLLIAITMRYLLLRIFRWTLCLDIKKYSWSFCWLVVRKNMPSTKKPKPIATWSMYKNLHDEVSNLLSAADLRYEFYEDDDDANSIRMRDTNIMGCFVCQNRACKARGWSSKMIAITIRLFPAQRYNARVYHQRCKFCRWLSRPLLDQSYAERIDYWIRQWNGIRVETPPISNGSNGPHNRQLCEGCQAGHCSQSGGDWVAQLDRYFIPDPWKRTLH